MAGASTKPVVETQTDQLSRLAFKGESTIQARGGALAVAIDAEGRSWALAAHLLTRYEIAYAWTPICAGS